MSNIDKQALREAAEKYRTTYAAHLKNPRNYDALDAWDKATSEFMALVNNDELNIIASLIDEIDMETGYREGAFVACNRWHTKFRETEARLEAAEKRIAELERSETQLINERDDAESALNDAYKAVMGQAPEWSNWFGFADAIDEIELACGLWRNQTEDVIQFRQRIAELEALAKSVKFDPIPMEELGNKSDGKKHPYMFGAGYNSAVVHCESVLSLAFAAAGIGKGE